MRVESIHTTLGGLAYASALGWGASPVRGPVRRPARADSAAVVQVPVLSGDHVFAIRDQTLPVDDATGVTLRVSDLRLSLSERDVYADGQVYRLPVWSEGAAVEIAGSGGDDRIDVSQDGAGNTILTVEQAGGTHRIDLGRIAALTIRSGAGDDRIAVNAERYFGGVVIDAGDGEDEVSADIRLALARGVTVRGGGGVDRVALSGAGLAAAVYGGEGNDRLDVSGLDAGGWAVDLYGDGGNDTLVGSSGADTLHGGGGNDAVFGGRDADMLFGDAGDDRIDGGSGDDMLFGGAGVDRLEGGPGDDRLFGDAGGDHLYGGSGRDMLWGGSGADALAPAVIGVDKLQLLARLTSALRVSARGETRAHPILTLNPWVDEGLGDFDSAIDSLLNRGSVV